MGRLLSLSAIAAGALAAVPARAAEVTRVATTEADGAFSFSVDVRYDRVQKKATITREFADPATGAIKDGAELAYTQVTDRVVPRVAFGVWRDLEIHASIPYLIDDTPSWDYAKEGGVSVGSQPGRSAIDNNILNASGLPCDPVGLTPCKMFPAVGKLHAGGLGDLVAGVTWGVMSEKRDPWAPTWVVTLDVTLPTASRFDPAAGRTTQSAFFSGPSYTKSDRAPVGRKIWVYDLGTALSKRVGKVEPYLRADVRIPRKTSSTYSNCEHAGELESFGQMWTGATTSASVNCASDYWKTRAEAEPPLVVGMLFGAEILPWEDRGAGKSFSVDLRVSGDYYGRGRWYNELTPATGKLMANDAYFTTQGLLGLRYQSSRHVRLGLLATLQHDFAHFISGEGQGHVSNELVTPNSPEQNPNFDFRWDLPGRRFRVNDTVSWSLSLEFEALF